MFVGLCNPVNTIFAAEPDVRACVTATVVDDPLKSAAVAEGLLDPTATPEALNPVGAVQATPTTGLLLQKSKI
jgi:hypothetical protein